MFQTIWRATAVLDSTFGRITRRTHLLMFALLSLGGLVLPISLKSQDIATDTIVETKVAETKAVATAEGDTFSSRLFRTHLDGSEAKPLTVFPEYTSQGSPEWSSDGKLICFDVWKTGGSTATGQIALVQADGSNPRTICDGLMPSFSPGGKRIAFSRTGANYGIWIMSTDGPDTELVHLDERGWGTSWAPDGRIAFATSRAGMANLVVLNIVEGTRELVFDEQESPYQQIYWNFAWSPDSRRIVFKAITTHGKKEVGIVDVRGVKFGHIRRPELSTVHESFTWSPDGARILVTKACPERANRAQIYSFNPDKNESLELLSKQDSERPCTTAAYAPDGKSLVVSCQMKAPPKATAKDSEAKVEIPVKK